MELFTERHADKICGELSCLDRVVITGQTDGQVDPMPTILQGIGHPALTGGCFQGRFAFLWQPRKKTLDALSVNGYFFTPADLASWIKHDVSKRMLVQINSNGIRSFHASFSFPMNFALHQP
jgi:hypothetical protein